MRRTCVPVAICTVLALGCSGGNGGAGDPTDPGPGTPDPPAQQTGTISGSVVDIMGPGIAGVTIGVTGPENRTAQTSAAGAFQLTNLPTGSYTVTVEPPDGYVVALGASEQASAGVTGGGTAEVEFRLAVEADADVMVVRLTGLTFSPSEVSVPVGSRIRWLATETLDHTVTPDGHSEWAEYPLSNPGATFEHRFESDGSFPYYCAPHRADGMTGVINVTQ